MEFGLFLNGYLPGPGGAQRRRRAHDAQAGDAVRASTPTSYNWKYAWFGEHHALTEYSHMSAPECVIPYVAAKTERIHLGSAIMNLSPPVNQPTRNAERVAMLDHVTGGRYEWGTGRGAGEHEMQTFDLHTSETKEMWNEVAPEILRMFEQRDYTFEGEFFRVPSAAQHPAEALRRRVTRRCGSAAATPARSPQAGELGIGAIAFNFEPIYNLKGRIDAYKEGIANCTEPLGAVRQRQRDDDQRRGVRGRSPAGPRDRDVARAAATSTRWSTCTTTTMPPQTGRGEVARRAAPDPRRGDARLPDRERATCCAATPTRSTSRSRSTRRSAATSSCSASRTRASSTKRCWR